MKVGDDTTKGRGENNEKEEPNTVVSKAEFGDSKERGYSAVLCKAQGRIAMRPPSLGEVGANVLGRPRRAPEL